MRLVLRPTIPHPDLSYLDPNVNVLLNGHGHAASGVRLQLARDEGRPVDFLEIDGDVAAQHAAELEDAMWQHLPDLRPVSDDQFGRYQDGREVRHSSPLALTQLLIAYHLLRKYSDLSQLPFAAAGIRAEPPWDRAALGRADRLGVGQLGRSTLLIRCAQVPGVGRRAPGVTVHGDWLVFRPIVGRKRCLSPSARGTVPFSRASLRKSGQSPRTVIPGLTQRGSFVATYRAISPIGALTHAGLSSAICHFPIGGLFFYVDCHRHKPFPCGKLSRRSAAQLHTSFWWVVTQDPTPPT